ncbi:MAG TPA: site-specific integrase [Burkholderiales bacterium]|nr:site-specific integrase [Burkholderiales bacterium]
MARSQRSSKLETRTGRLKLPLGSREFLTIGKGLALGYRRTEDGYGTWQARVWDGSRYLYKNLGRADDFQDANGVDVLDFYQAQGMAREFYEEVKRGGPKPPDDVTVREAAEHYLAWFRQHRRALRETEHALNAHILPALGDMKVAELSAKEIREWIEKLATRPARARTGKFAKTQRYRPAPRTAEEKRARRATANRVFAVLKALLNRAFEDGMVQDDTAWRRVRPFPKVDEARIRFLTHPEAVRLVNACAADLRPLVRAALVTGARYGELVALRTQDVNLDTGRVYIAQSKSGRPRYVPLNPEGLTFFKAAVAGKTGDMLVFTKADGSAWGKNHHVRPLAEACRAAKVTPPIAFHELRHTYASHLAQAGVDLLTISKLLGHADTRITAKHYAHLADTTLAQAVTKLPSFGPTPATQVKAIP